MANVKEMVAERIANSGPTILEGVIEHLVKETVDKRKAVAVQGYAEYAKLEKELLKLKADQLIYDENGAVIQQGFKKETVDAIKKTKEKMEKLNRAIDKALDKNDWGDLTNLVGKVNNDG